MPELRLPSPVSCIGIPCSLDLETLSFLGCALIFAGIDLPKKRLKGAFKKKKIKSYLKLSFREGNCTPLQYSCLENPMDGGAWSVAVHGVTKSWTRLSNFTFTHWRRKWQPTPVFLPGESQRRGSVVGCHLWGLIESDMTEAT